MSAFICDDKACEKACRPVHLSPFFACAEKLICLINNFCIFFELKEGKKSVTNAGAEP